MCKEDIRCLCQRHIATLHCKSGDYKITVAFLALGLLVLLFHLCFCKYRCLKEESYKRKLLKLEKKE